MQPRVGRSSVLPVFSSPRLTCGILVMEGCKTIKGDGPVSVDGTRKAGGLPESNDGGDADECGRKVGVPCWSLAPHLPGMIL